MASSRLWHKHYHRDFLEGVHGLGADAIGAYIVILNLIYSRDGRCPDDPRFIGAILGESARATTKLIERLIEAGKLRRIDGQLVNDKATSVLGSDAKLQEKLAESGAKGGRERAKREAELRNSNGLGQAGLNHTCAKREIREENIAPSPQRTTPREAAAGADRSADASPPTRAKGAVPAQPTRLAAVAAEVRKRARMVEPPGDTGIVEGWLSAGIDPDSTIYPTVEAIGQREAGRGKSVRTYRYLDLAVREAHAERAAKDRADVERWTRTAASYGPNPSVQPPHRPNGGASR